MFFGYCRSFNKSDRAEVLTNWIPRISAINARYDNLTDRQSDRWRQRDPLKKKERKKPHYFAMKKDSPIQSICLHHFYFDKPYQSCNSIWQLGITLLVTWLIYHVMYGWVWCCHDVKRALFGFNMVSVPVPIPFPVSSPMSSSLSVCTFSVGLCLFRMLVNFSFSFIFVYTVFNIQKKHQVSWKKWIIKIITTSY